jgi:hypothetical protein
VLQGQRLSDEAAHGPPKHAYSLETERLDYVRGITSEPGDVEWLSVVGRSAAPAVVEKNQLAVRGEPVDE